jgi:hypothetical protein
MRILAGLVLRHKEEYSKYNDAEYEKILNDSINKKLPGAKLKKYLGKDKTHIVLCPKKGKPHIIRINDINIIYKDIICTSCRNTGNSQLILEKLNTIAGYYGGKLLSTEYDRAAENVEWQCKRNHKWKASSNQISDKYSWCRRCPRLPDNERETIKQQIIKLNELYIMKNIKVKEVHNDEEKKYIELVKDIYNKDSVAGLDSKLKEKYPGRKISNKSQVSFYINN